MKDKFINKSTTLHKNKYDYSLVEYKNTKTLVKIICPSHGLFLQRPEHHMRGQGCSQCGNLQKGISQRNNLQSFIEKAKLIHKDKYDYSLAIYLTSKIKIKIICPIHGIWEQKPNHHLLGKGCRQCSGSAKLTTEIFVNRALEIHENKYDYSLVVYKGHYEKVNVICPIHGIFEQGAGSHLSGVGCPQCIESKGEKEIFNFLILKGILFETQKAFDGCKLKKKLRFDFFLPEKNMCIEYDGEQHFIPVKKWGGIENLEIIQKRDKIKAKFCQDNNIQLLRISYKESVKEILKLNL
jgi:hypothetical protein